MHTVLRGLRSRLSSHSVWLRLLALALAMLFGTLHQLGPRAVLILRDTVFDSYQRAMPRVLEDPPTLVVDIDEASLARLGQWPWRRDQIATLTANLLQAGARVVGYDVVFAEADRVSPDSCRALAGPRAASLASLFASLPPSESRLQEVIADRPVVLGLAPNLDAGIRQSRPDPWPIAERRQAGNTDDLVDWIPHLPAVVHNLPILEDAAAGRGVFQGSGLVDSVIRQVPTLVAVEQGETVTRYPSLALEMLRVGLKVTAPYAVQMGPEGSGLVEVSLPGAIGPLTEPRLVPPGYPTPAPVFPSGDGAPIRLFLAGQGPAALLADPESGQMLKVWRAGSGDSFPVFAAGQGPGLRLFEAERPQPLRIRTDPRGQIWLHFAPYSRARYLSAADVLEGRFDPADVAGRFVLLGTSAEGLRDIRRTPVDASLPGVEVHAQAIDSVLTGTTLNRSGLVLAIETLVLMLAALALIALVPNLPLWGNLLLILTVLAGLIGAGWHLFASHRILFDWGLPAVTAGAVFLLLLIGNYLREDGQRRFIRRAFGLYLSPDLVEILAREPDRLSVGGESREITILFTDIAGFTGFAERTDPALAVKLLQSYLDQMLAVVLRFGGTVDKLIGDAIIAFFNAPLDQPDHRSRAIACVQEMDRVAEQFRAGLDPALGFGQTRIGVHCGRVSVGNFGSSTRFNYTAYGDSMNTASRLEGANKHLGTRLCISEPVIEGRVVPHLIPAGRLLLKGKTEALAVHVGAEDPDFPAAWEPLHAQLAAGEPPETLLAEVEALRQRFPQEPILALYRDRLQRGEAGVLITLDEK